MKTITNPTPDTWDALCRRPVIEFDTLTDAVRQILHVVKAQGDQALLDLTTKFDKVHIDNLVVGKTEIALACKNLPIQLKEAIQIAAKNITTFHQAQKREVMKVETMEGVSCWRKGVPITQVGIYIPGGSAPLFSTVLMLAIPAKLAGCEEIVLCTPPGSSGKIHDAILYTAQLVGVSRICQVGGAQAIAALAYGTKSVPQVSKIFGPGNQYVTKAKQLVSEEGVAIDMPAGPSEVLVWADETAQPSFVAADLLSQAEHGEDSQVILVVTPSTNLMKIEQELTRQLDELPRKEIAKKALDNSLALCFETETDAINFINTYAPEHLIINTTHAEAKAEKIINAGSVFIGSFTPESAGDYASGTNHTLPTNGYAKAYGGVSLESFMKYITFQKISKSGIQKLGPIIEVMAEAESLMGHKRAVSERLQFLNEQP